MSDLVVNNFASINTIPENSEISLYRENEINRDKNIITEPQVSKEAFNTSESTNNVENTNILQDKTSKFNNSQLFLNQQPPVDSLMKVVENTLDISVNTKENLNLTQNVHDKNKNRRLTIINRESEDDNLDNLVEKNTTNVVKEIENEENPEISTDEDIKLRKWLTIMNSDSDDDLNNRAEKDTTNVEKAIDNEENSNTSPEKHKKQRKRLTILNSDSEDDNKNISDKEDDGREEYGPTKDKGEKKIQRKRLTVINSDSDDSESENVETIIAHQEGLDVASTVESSTEETSKEQTVDNSGKETKKSRLMQICDSDSEDENAETANDVNINSVTPSENMLTNNTERTARLQNLCDSESSAEEEETPKINYTQVSNAKRTVKPSKDKDLLEKPMTGRDAMEQRRQIKSESQKMCRESHISLPYHRPKQHTLQDFLKRRSLLNNIIKVPSNTSTSYAIKMSAQELKMTVQQLKEREKNIVLFYKSESEEEEESEEQVDTCSKTQVENTQKEIGETGEQEEKKSEEFATDETNLSESDKIEEEIMEVENEAVQEQEEVKIIEEFQVEKEINDEEMESIKIKITEVIDKIDDIVTEEGKENAEIDKASEEGMDESNEKDTEDKLEVLRQENLGSTDKKIKEPSFEELLSSTILPPQVESQKKITPEKEKENKIEEKLKKLNPLISLKRSFEPLRLSGDPNEIIVLDEGLERSKNVSNLMKRFFIHTAKKQVQKKTEISVLNADGSGRHHETIIVSEDVEEPAKKHQIPGLRMKKLREELQEQIKQKRLEEFMKKKAEYILDNEEGDGSVYEGEKTDCGLGDEVLDNDEEEELTDEDTSSEEDEEEDDVELQDKPRVKSAFVDEEAEESDLDDQENEPVEDEEEDEEEEDGDDQDEKQEDETKRPLKRIIQTLDDSDDEKVDENTEENQEEFSDHVDMSTQEQSQLRSTWDEFDGEIPAYQPRNGLEKTPCKLMTQNKQDISCFISPTLNLTALQGRKPCDSPIIEESPKIVVPVPAKPSPLRNHPFLKTRLFSQNSENLPDFDELAALCSGKFPSPKKNNQVENLSTQEQSLLDICSGTFSGLEGLDNDAITTEAAIQNSEETCGTSQEISKEEITQSSNMKIFDVRNFNCSKFRIASSSDEESVAKEDQNKKKKLKKKRRYIIDDISLSEDEENKENDFDDMSLDEEGNEFDELDREKEEDNDERGNINYDSEENEVDYEESVEVVKKKAREFFEAEAELSGSEWGSEDEDEKELDEFEVEDADGEKINEKKVQQELERMHIRNILDEDQRDVRLLQELLLEDGELHGEGREKKFKWKNTTSSTWDEENTPKEEDEDVEDIESEQQWRKLRHEREAFLNEQKIKAQEQFEEEDITGSDSQFLKLGQMALQNSQMQTSVTESIVKMGDIKLPFNLNNKRGSFLARSETTLARLAELTRTTGGLNNRAKNSRNFVFTAVEKTENEKKRKADEHVPKIPKKIRITNSGPDANKKITKVQPKS